MFRFLWDAVAHQFLSLKRKGSAFLKQCGLNLDWSCLERSSIVISIKHWFLSSQEHCTIQDLLLLFLHGRKIVNDTNYMTQMTHQHLSSVPGQQELQLQNKDIATWKEFRVNFFFFFQKTQVQRIRQCHDEWVDTGHSWLLCCIFLVGVCSDSAMKWNGIYPLPSVLTIARHNKVNKEEWQMSINSDLFSIMFIFIHN